MAAGDKDHTGSATTDPAPAIANRIPAERQSEDRLVISKQQQLSLLIFHVPPEQIWHLKPCPTLCISSADAFKEAKIPSAVLSNESESFHSDPPHLPACCTKLALRARWRLRSCPRRRDHRGRELCHHVRRSSPRNPEEVHVAPGGALADARMAGRPNLGSSLDDP